MEFGLMTEHNLPEKDDAPWLDTTYDGFMSHEEMLSVAAQREAANEAIIAKVSEEDYQKVQEEVANKAALQSLGIDYESFGQKPWNEGDLDYYAPNGDYIKSYPLINRVEVIGKNGREFVQYDCSNVQVSVQDEGRTLKVFLS